MLIQLPNYDWINPQDVQSVSVTLDERGDYRVVTRVAGIDYDTTTVLSETAYALRDKIAEDINSTCVWESKGART